MRLRKRLAIAVMAMLCGIALCNFTCTPAQLNWAGEIESIATVIVDGAGAAGAVADPAAAPLIIGIENAFGAIVKAAQAAQANSNAGTLAALSAAVQSADANVAQLEVAVKNPGTSATIVSLTNVFANALAEIVAQLQAQKAGMAAGHWPGEFAGLNAGLTPQLVASGWEVPVLKSHGHARGKGSKDFKKQISKALKKKH